MTNSQKLSLKLSEMRGDLNGLIEKRNKLPADVEPEASDIESMDGLAKRIQSTETEFRANIVAEEEQHAEDAAADPSSDATELEALLQRSSLAPFVDEVLRDRPVHDGPEAELRSETLGDSYEVGMFPIELLLPQGEAGMVAPRIEHRVDAATTVAAAALADGSQASVLARVFTRSIAARLGVSMPMVPVGAVNYPILTGGTTAAQAADGTAVDAVAGTFTGHTLEPIRLSAGYLLNVRTGHQLRDFESVLRRDLAAVMADQMDQQVLNGDGTAPNVSGFLDELAPATDPTATSTYATYVEEFASLVDGINAFDLPDLRGIVGGETFAHMMATYRGNNDNVTSWEKLRQLTGGMSVSSRIPVATGATKDQTNLTALASYPGRNAVAPIWRGMQLIRDPYTMASSGQVRLTAVSFWNFQILREAGWALWKARTV